VAESNCFEKNIETPKKKTCPSPPLPRATGHPQLRRPSPPPTLLPPSPPPAGVIGRSPGDAGGGGLLFPATCREGRGYPFPWRRCTSGDVGPARLGDSGAVASLRRGSMDAKDRCLLPGSDLGRSGPRWAWAGHEPACPRSFLETETAGV
jgi:hypothetical protein